MKKNRNIPLFKVFMDKRIDHELFKVIHSGWVGQGDKVEQFEQLISEKINNDLCLSLSSGTHGLTLALRLIDLKNKKKGGSVICTPMTCFASNAPVLDNGAEIIWADIKDDMNIDSGSVVEKIREDTKAILFVHWGGYPADLERLRKISVDHNIPLIEDAAHAFGSSYRETPIGDNQYTDYGIFSWQAIKNLSTIDGGMLFVKDKKDYEEAKLLRWFGISRTGPVRDLRCREDIINFGYKFHMNDVNATIGIVNLLSFEDRLKTAQDNARFYGEALRDVSGIKIVQTEKDRDSSSWLYTIHVEDRTGFARKMGESGIAVSQVHARNDKFSCTKHFETYLPNLEKINPLYCCIPVGYWVTNEDREYIVEAVRTGW